MKPLVLVVYPKEITYHELIKLPPDIQRHVRRQVLVEQVEDRLRKHLTLAECVAEYWCSEWRCASPETTYEIKVESARRVAILHRFATLPPYDEEQ